MSSKRIQQVVTIVVASVVVCMGVATLPTAAGPATPTKTFTAIEEGSNMELVQLAMPFGEDGKPLLALTKEEIARAKKAAPAVKKMYREGSVQAASDYMRAASVLARTEESEDLLLANELAIAAVSKGEKRASQVLMWTHDRLLVESGKKQRFGTQYKRVSGKLVLLPIDGSVTDFHRQAVGVGTIADAKNLPRLAANRSAAASRRPAFEPKMARMSTSAF